MDDPLLIIALLACFGVLIVLLLGINSFRKSDTNSGAESNRWMRWRIGLQFVAVLLIMIFVYVRRQTGG
jgi:hypothetical protein